MSTPLDIMELSKRLKFNPQDDNDVLLRKKPCMACGKHSRYGISTIFIDNDKHFVCASGGDENCHELVVLDHIRLGHTITIDYYQPWIIPYLLSHGCEKIDEIVNEENGAVQIRQIPIVKKDYKK